MSRADRGRFVVALGVVLVLLASSCTTRSTETSTSSSLGTTTSTAGETSTTTTSVAATTTLETTTTTMPPTTTTTQDPPPSSVQGLTVGVGGGSGEVIPEWDRGAEADLDHYNVWYSEFPGETKSLLDAVPRDPADLSSPAYDYGSGDTAYIDFPRDLANDKQCYQISAVDAIGNEGERTPELCLSGL